MSVDWQEFHGPQFSTQLWYHPWPSCKTWVNQTQRLVIRSMCFHCRSRQAFRQRSLEYLGYHIVRHPWWPPSEMSLYLDTNWGHLLRQISHYSPNIRRWQCWLRLSHQDFRNLNPLSSHLSLPDYTIALDTISRHLMVRGQKLHWLKILQLFDQRTKMDAILRTNDLWDLCGPPLIDLSKYYLCIEYPKIVQNRSPNHDSLVCEESCL